MTETAAVGTDGPTRTTGAAVIHLDGALDELLAELPGRYSSPFSTAEYFAIYDRPRQLQAVELEAPRHVLAFTSRGATVDVLNKVIDIEPGAVRDAAQAIFRARPDVRRVRVEVKFPPQRIEGPHRAVSCSDEHVVELPASQAEYEASLGSSTRRNLRRARNRLQRTHPDFTLRTVEGADITYDLVRQAFAWSAERIAAKGQAWGFADQPLAMHQTWRLMTAHGVALCAFVEDRLVAVSLCLFVGRDAWAHTAGFDPAYLDLRLGVLMTSFVIAESIRRGCGRCHLLWGTPGYKRDLGARPVRAWRVSLYRSRLEQALYAPERWPVLWRERNDHYWRLRGAARRHILRLVGGAGERRPLRLGAGAGERPIPHLDDGAAGRGDRAA